MPLQKVMRANGMALSDEVQEVVSHRSGSILSALHHAKSDFFTASSTRSAGAHRRHAEPARGSAAVDTADAVEWSECVVGADDAQDAARDARARDVGIGHPTVEDCVVD